MKSPNMIRDRPKLAVSLLVNSKSKAVKLAKVVQDDFKEQLTYDVTYAQDIHYTSSVLMVHNHTINRLMNQ